MNKLEGKTHCEVMKCSESESDVEISITLQPFKKI